MASKALIYNDGEIVDLGDHIEVGVNSLLYEPEMAIVKCVGSKKILVEYDNDCVKPRVEWILPTECDMISRAT